MAPAQFSTYYSALRFLARCMRYRYRTEKLQLQTLMRLDLSGATVLDIGANKGIYCFWMSRAVGRLGRVIAFEPQPEMNVAISRLKSIFKWRNMKVLNVALSSVDGVAILARQRVGDGSASLQPSRRNVANETLMVATTKWTPSIWTSAISDSSSATSRGMSATYSAVPSKPSAAIGR